MNILQFGAPMAQIVHFDPAEAAAQERALAAIAEITGFPPNSAVGRARMLTVETSLTHRQACERVALELTGARPLPVQ